MAQTDWTSTKITSESPAEGCRPSIFQYWHSAEVPEPIAELFATFRDRNPDFRHRVFSETEAEEFIAAHCGSRELQAFRTCAVPAMQADYFRYCAVLAQGGIYSDADYRCVRPLNPFLDQCDGGGTIFLRPDPHTLAGREAKRALNGFFAFPDPGHPFLRMTIEIATANLEARIAERVWPVGENVTAGIWLTVGPGIFTVMRAIHNWGSFDAFLGGVKETLAEPFGELFCEVIGDYERLAEACEGVRFHPFESLFTWVDHPEQLLSYKETDRHWKNVRTRIFR